MSNSKRHVILVSLVTLAIVGAGCTGGTTDSRSGQSAAVEGTTQTGTATQAATAATTASSEATTAPPPSTTASTTGDGSMATVTREDPDSTTAGTPASATDADPTSDTETDTAHDSGDERTRTTESSEGDGNVETVESAREDGSAATEGDGPVSYQIDLVAGEPLERLSADTLYAKQDRLIRFAHGDTETGITEHGTAWTTEEIRSAIVDVGPISREGDTATVTFTVKEGHGPVTVSLVSYETPEGEFSPETAERQSMVDATTESLESGTHTLTVSLPEADAGTPTETASPTTSTPTTATATTATATTESTSTETESTTTTTTTTASTTTTTATSTTTQTTTTAPATTTTTTAPTTTQTATTTTTSERGTSPVPIEIVRIDAEDEYVEVRNAGDRSVDLGELRIDYDDGQDRSPSSYVIGAGETALIGTGDETDEAVNVQTSTGYEGPVLNNDGDDVVSIYDANGDLVDRLTDERGD